MKGPGPSGKLRAAQVKSLSEGSAYACLDMVCAGKGGQGGQGGQGREGDRAERAERAERVERAERAERAERGAGASRTEEALSYEELLADRELTERDMIRLKISAVMSPRAWSAAAALSLARIPQRERGGAVGLGGPRAG
jgi:hypothetical protein